MINKTWRVHDGRIYPHGRDSYDTSFDWRRYLMIRINAYNANTIGRTVIENTLWPARCILMSGTNTTGWLQHWTAYPSFKWYFRGRTDPVVHHWKGPRAFKKLNDLLGGIRFTIRTDHRNLLYLNNHGFRKVLQWKLDIQHYNAVVEHFTGEQNFPADVFSRLVTKPDEASLHQILIFYNVLMHKGC